MYQHLQKKELDISDEYRALCSKLCTSFFPLDNLTLLDYNEGMKQWTPDEIKDFRQRLGLYQKDLAALLRVSTNYVYLLEKGVRSPSNTMKALLDCIQREHERKTEVK